MKKIIRDIKDDPICILPISGSIVIVLVFIILILDIIR